MTRSQILLRNQDVLAGLLFLVIAGIVAWGAHHLPMGSGVRMGPGMFPMILCGLLAFLGLLTLVEGLRSATPENATAPLAWGRMLVICGSGVFFALTLAPLGLLGSRLIFLHLFVVAAVVWWVRQGLAESQIWAEEGRDERLSRLATNFVDQLRDRAG